MHYSTFFYSFDALTLFLKYWPAVIISTVQKADFYEIQAPSQ